MQNRRRNLKSKSFPSNIGCAGTCGMASRQGEGERDDSNKAWLLTRSRTNTRDRQGQNGEIKIKNNQVAADSTKEVWCVWPGKLVTNNGKHGSK